MQKVLMIEDIESHAKTVRNTIKDHFPEVVVRIQSDFKQGLGDLDSWDPDVLILDLRQGSPGAEECPGDLIWHTVWMEKFCPIVIYSAFDPDFEVPEHPFVRFVKKGRKSDLEVVDALKSFRPHAEAIRSVSREMHSVMQAVLKTVAELVWREEPDDATSQRDILLRAARRRIAATMDEGLFGSEERMHGWEQYLIPAFGVNPLTGDLLRRADADSNDVGAYAVILTPSCDMVAGEGDCVERVLVAKCHDYARYLKAISVGLNAKPETIREKLPKKLTQAHWSGKVLLPECPRICPMMCVDLRDLDLIELKVIGVAYERVVSIDSPFREQIAWAYHQDSGRPGMPDRCFDAIAEAIIAVGQQTENGKKGSSK